jgi:hypothetical protein
MQAGRIAGLALAAITTFAQAAVERKVTNPGGRPLPGVTVTLDTGSSDDESGDVDAQRQPGKARPRVN